MPDFSFASIPGLEGSLTISDGATGVPVQVGLKDAVLFLPGQERLDLTASHQRTGSGPHLITLTGTFQPPKSLIGGQLSLTDLTLTLQFVTGTSGQLVLDTAATQPVTARGNVVWSGATALGFAGGVPLTVAYSYRSGGISGFSLALANPPVTLPGGFAEIARGEMAVEIVSDRPVFAVLARGQAQLTTSSLSQVNSLVAQIFPSAPALQPVGFEIRQEFSLVNGAIPASPAPLGLPTFAMDFNFPGGAAPALSNVPPPLRVDIGFPRLTLPFGGSQGWTLRLPNSGLRFPDIPALQPFSLAGTLRIEQGVGNRLAFEPTQSGGFALPDPLQFLLSRLQWNGSSTPLDQVAQQASTSVTELEWDNLFANLLPSPLPTGGLNLSSLVQQLGNALRSAIADSGLAIERVFATAFRSLTPGGRTAFEAGWQNWFDPSTGPANPLQKLPDLLLSLQSLSLSAFRDAIDALFRTSFSVPDFAKEFGKSWATATDVRLPAFTDTWSRLIGSLPQVKIDTLARGWMDAIIRMPELNVSRTFTLSSGLAFSLPAGDGLLAVSFTDMLKRSANGEQVNVAGWWSSIFKESKRTDPAEKRRAKEAIQNAVETAAREAPDASIVELLALIFQALKNNSFPWWELIEKPPETRGGQFLKLPAPGPGRKYLIFSDVHRDRAKDTPTIDPGNIRSFRSIAHFTKNKKLFLRALDYAIDQGYTVIENGDCEELWFYADRDEMQREETIDGKRYKGRAKLMKQIVKSHPEVYSRLRTLGDRYRRTYGNHDHYLRPSIDRDCAKVLNEAMTGDETRDYPVYDFIIIDGVKAMTEHTWFTKAADIARAIKDRRPLEPVLRDLSKGIVGMDAEDYGVSDADRCRMLITHGHQWDFYNCDVNNDIGQWVAGRAVDTDLNMDMVLAFRGLALGGSPLLDFASWMSDKPVVSSWPSAQDAIGFAHKIQHMPNADRKLTDTVLYKESLAAMTGGFGIPLNTPDGKTPADTRANIRNVGDAVNYLLKHHNHHLCIGHTHNPHSQPHFTLHNIGTGLPLIGNLIMALRAILPAPPNPNLFKSKYFNSGTCGWWESVLWAIEIGETGQAKLVFWTDRQTKPPDALLAPETMDWELTKWDPSLTKTVAEAIEEFRRFLGDKAVGLADEIEDALQTIGGYPSELFHIAVALGDQVWSNAEAQFREASLAAQNAVRDLQERIAELRTHTLAFVLTLQSRVLKFRTATQDSASFVFSFAGPDAFAAEGLDIARDKLKQYQDLLVPPGGDAVERARALHAALIAYPLAEKFPRNIMPATNVNDLLNPVRRFMDSETPVLGVFSSVAAMFPTPGAVVKIGDQTITSELAFADGESKLKLTVTIRTDASAVHTPPAEPVS